MVGTIIITINPQSSLKSQGFTSLSSKFFSYDFKFKKIDPKIKYIYALGLSTFFYIVVNFNFLKSFFLFLYLIVGVVSPIFGITDNFLNLPSEIGDSVKFDRGDS